MPLHPSRSEPVSEDEARALVLADLTTRYPLVITSCRLSNRGGHWILTANTEDFLRTGDYSRALIGLSEVIVDRATGAVEALGGAWSAEDILQDRLDLTLAAGRHWVVRPLASAGAADIIKLRRWLGCTPSFARQRMRGGAWLVGPRSSAQRALEQLQGLGLPVELALVDDPGQAVHLFHVGAELEGLRCALVSPSR
jgi:hypothetical protein